jgi:transposase
MSNQELLTMRTQKENNVNLQDNAHYIGVDVAKATLDAYRTQDKATRQFPNSKEGFKQFLKWCKEMPTTLVICEATGGYEKNFVFALADAEIPFRVVNPARVRDFAKSCGILAKTDKLDAKVLAKFAAERRLEPQKLQDETQRRLKELIGWRRQLVKARTMHRNQLEHASDKMVIKGTKSLIEQIEKQIKKVETELNQLIDDDPQLSNLNDILLSIPGIGQEVARTLIVELPDLGSGDPAKLCSLAGVVPFNCDSGLFRGKRRIYGGRGTLRTVLYMAALTAVKCVKADNVFKQLYLRITATKPHKVGIVAVMHKMIIIAHALVKNNEKWKNKLIKNNAEN